jgi:hypothetical protein
MKITGGKMRRMAAVAGLIAVFMLSLMAQTKKDLDQALTPDAMKNFETERARLYQWESFKFLTGQWKTESPTANSGFEVKPSLDGKVLIISNREPGIAAGAKRKATNYKSLIFVYVEGLMQKATLYDSEGKVITYNIQAAPQKVAFVSTVASRPSLVFEESKEGTVSIAVGQASAAKLVPQATIQAVRVSK